MPSLAATPELITSATPILSVRAPWSLLIMTGSKPLENRSWTTPIRGRIGIHTSTVMSKADYYYASDMCGDLGVRLPTMEECRRYLGHLMGTVELIDCRRHTDSLWHENGAYGWMLGNPRMLQTPVKRKGRLRFWYLK